MKLMYLEVLLEKGYLLEPREHLGEPCSFLEIAGVIKSFCYLLVHIHNHLYLQLNNVKWH